MAPADSHVCRVLCTSTSKKQQRCSGQNGSIAEQQSLHAQPNTVFHWMGPQVRVESRLCNHLPLSPVLPAAKGQSGSLFFYIAFQQWAKKHPRTSG
jgi:hypothetical protein